MTSATVLIVPGLRDHVAEHWQTLLAARLPKAVSVPPLTTDKLSLKARVAAISAAANSIEGPVVICAHSAGVVMTAHWAMSPSRPIKAALLACPPDIDVAMPAGYPTLAELEAGGWFPVPRQPLPFPALVLGSETDHLAKLERTQALAAAWGAKFVNLGAVGHLNPTSGHGHWPEAERWLAEAEALAG
jgi:predicted alpha/beta hydrolase family esterase